MSKEEKKEMLLSTTEEYQQFFGAVIDKQVSFYVLFEMLYWNAFRRVACTYDGGF